MNVFLARACPITSALTRSVFRPSCLNVFGDQRRFYPSSSDVGDKLPKNKYGDQLFAPEDQLFAPEDTPQTPSLVETSPDFLPDPSFQSLGLGGFSPIGLMQQALEFLHVSADLPWWAAIATGTTLVRLCLLPVVVKNRQELARIIRANYKMTKILTDLIKAQKEGKNDIGFTKSGATVLKLSSEHKSIMDQVSYKKLVGLALVQSSVFISMVVAIRGIAAHEIPSLTTGGLAWFSNLAVPDPLGILPLWCSMSVFAILLAGRNANVPLPPIALKFFYVMTPVIFLVLLKYEAALAFYFCVNSTITIVQAKILNHPNVQEYFNLNWPRTIKQEDKISPDDLQALRQAIEELQERQILQQLERDRGKDKKEEEHSQEDEKKGEGGEEKDKKEEERSQKDEKKGEGEEKDMKEEELFEDEKKK